MALRERQAGNDKRMKKITYRRLCYW